ncbi:MAG: nuclease-related domain-containing protein [Vicinamibacteria bacterium]
MESESLPRVGTAPSYELRSSAGAAAPERAFEQIDADALKRIERRLVKRLRGSGVIVIHDLVVPATGTAIDHLCIGANAITAIDVERTPDGQGRGELVDRVLRETEALAAIMNDVGIASEQIGGAICHSTRGIPIRCSSIDAITIGDARGTARLARRPHSGNPVNVDLAMAMVRTRLGREGQRWHRTSRPDWF